MKFLRCLSSHFPLLRSLLIFAFLLAAATWLPASLPLPDRAAQSVVKLAPPLLRLPALQIRMLFDARESLRQDAQEMTRQDLVKYLRPKSQDQPWQLQTVQLQTVAGQPPWIAAALSLPPEQGLICLLVPQDQHYILFYLQEGLLPITKLSTYPMIQDSPQTSWDLLQVTQRHEENLGAYSQVEQFSLWSWQNQQLRQIFTENTQWQLCFPANQGWVLAKQALTVEVQGSTLTVKGQQDYALSQEGATAPTEPLPPPPGQSFRPAKSRSIQALYHFDPQYQRFGLGLGLWQPHQSHSNSINHKPIFILKDMTQDLEAPYRELPPEYLVINPEGITSLLPQNQVKRLP